MDNKTAKWVTVAQAAEITDRPTNSISNWYLYDKTVRHMRVSARRVLVHLGDCIEQDKIRARRRRKQSPVVVAVPAVSVEVVPFSLAGQQCQGWRIDGEELLDAGLLGRLLDYAGKGLVNTITGAWSGEFIDGEHFRIIDGPALEALKAQPVENNSTGSVPKHSSSITALTRAGVALVLLKTHKPIGVALRRALAGAHFMRELLDGNPEPMRQAVTAAPNETAAILTMLGQQNQAMMQFFAQQAQESRAMMQTLLEAVQSRKTDSVVINVGGKPEVITDPADCCYTKEKILRMVNQEFPAVVKWSQISQPARDLGIFIPESYSGTRGMAEYRRSPDAQWPRIFLSWAFKEWACDYFRGVGYIHIPA